MIKEVYWGGVFYIRLEESVACIVIRPALRWQTEPHFFSLKKNKLEKISRFSDGRFSAFFVET